MDNNKESEGIQIIGIKFCGGCNPRYNRRGFLEKLKETYNQHQFELAEENKKYNLLIIIGGCSCCCASYEEYKYDRILKFWDYNQFPQKGLI